MPVLITGAARAQYLGMVARYLQTRPGRPSRPDAARKLVQSYDVAVDRIAAGASAWLSHSRPYPDLARYGFRWIKVHRYWIAYVSGPPPIITNIFDAAADIPSQVSEDDDPSELA